MKETPILFSSVMVKSIMEGKKTQTRRIVKGTALKWLQDGMFTPGFVSNPDNHLCPYGKTGDKIWAREFHYRYGIWRKNGSTKAGKQKWRFFPDKQFTEVRYYDNPPARVEKNTYRKSGWYKRSSLFMPKEYCRLFLDINNIWIERLQEIGEQDAVAEGITFIDKEDPYTLGYQLYGNHNYKDLLGRKAETGTSIESYETLWKMINGTESWEANPFVWVIEFKPCTG